METEDLIASVLVSANTTKEDEIEKTFSSTSVGKNIIELKRCHVTIGNIYDEMMASIVKMEEQFKKQPNMSMVVQEGVKLFKNNMNKLKAIKGKQVREALAIETELKQHIIAEKSKSASSDKKRGREGLDEEQEGFQTPLKKSAGRRSPKGRTLKVSSAVAAAKKLAAARLAKPPTANVTVRSQVDLVKDNGDDGRSLESQTPVSPSVNNEDNEDFRQFTGRRNRRKKRRKEERKQREEETGKKKKPNRKKIPKARDKAVTIKLPEGRAYADVLKQIKEKVSGQATEAKISAVRKTQAGNVLIEMKGKEAGQTALFEAVKTTMGENVTVTCLTPRRTLQIRDIDCLTSVEEIEAALKVALKDPGPIKVRLSRPNLGEQRSSAVEMDEQADFKLVKKGIIKLGLGNCRVRLQATPLRCFRCLAYGHIASKCEGPDRSKLCFKCGMENHKADDCRGKLRCFLCKSAKLKGKELNHFPGSRKCSEFRKAISL